MNSFCKSFAKASDKKAHRNNGLESVGDGGRLLHEQHLPCALDGRGHATLISGGQTGVFAREDAAVVRHKLAKQVRVAEIECIDGEIDLRLRALEARLVARIATLVFLVLAGHDVLLNFAVKSVATEEGVKLLLLDLFLLDLLVAGGLVTGHGLAFLFGFRAFDGDYFAGHEIMLSL